MESYFKFLYEVLKQFFGGFWKIISNVFLGLFDIVNLPGYIKDLEEYCDGFGAIGWVLAILTMLVLLALLFVIVITVIALIRMSLRKRKLRLLTRIKI